MPVPDLGVPASTPPIVDGGRTGAPPRYGHSDRVGTAQLAATLRVPPRLSVVQRHRLAGAAAWRQLAVPSVHTDIICPPLLVPAGATIAWIDGCDGDTFTLDATRWDPVPPPGALEAGISHLAHLAGHPVAIHWMTPGPQRGWAELVPG